MPEQFKAIAVMQDGSIDTRIGTLDECAKWADELFANECTEVTITRRTNYGDMQEVRSQGNMQDN